MRLKLLGLVAGVLTILAMFGVDSAAARRGHGSAVLSTLSKTPVLSFACNLLPSAHRAHTVEAALGSVSHPHSQTFADAPHNHADAATTVVDHGGDARSASTTSHAGHEHPATARAVAPAPETSHDHTQSGECHPTPEQYDAAMKLAGDTKAAVVNRFADVKAAIAAGYRPNQSAAGPFGHYVNDRERSSDDILDPNHVESLVYAKTNRHGWVLIGVMYMMPKPGMAGPAIGGCLTRWHNHYSDEPGPTGDPEKLHVWVVDMPGGPYAENPDADYVRGL